MNKLKLLKLFSEYEELSEGDFTPGEIEDFAAYLEGAEAPLSPREWKARYFNYYDDVKDKSLKKQDW